MGILWTAIVESEETASDASHLCLGCGRCDATCPVEIPLSRMLLWLKSRRRGGRGSLV